MDVGNPEAHQQGPRTQECENVASGTPGQVFVPHGLTGLRIQSLVDCPPHAVAVLTGMY